MIIRLLNKDNIDNLIEKSKSSLSDYRYFVSDEKDSLFDRTPSAISFDDETSEYLVSFEKELPAVSFVDEVYVTSCDNAIVVSDIKIEIHHAGGSLYAYSADKSGILTRLL